MSTLKQQQQLSYSACRRLKVVDTSFMLEYHQPLNVYPNSLNVQNEVENVSKCVLMKMIFKMVNAAVYYPHSEGGIVFSSVRLCVCLSVSLFR